MGLVFPVCILIILFMCRRTMVALALLFGHAFGEDAPEGLLDRIRAQVQDNLRKLPDYTCLETVERFGRFGAEKPWERADVLKLEVGLSKNKEIYSWHGAGQFSDGELADMVGKGTIGTGHFGLLLKHVFQPGAAQFTYKGLAEVGETAAHLFDFDVVREKSGYRLRTATGEAVTGFQGSFWVHRENGRLLKLEVQAYDIPDGVELAQADHLISYAPVMLGEAEFMMPELAEMHLVATDGQENLNRIRISGCREFQAQSKLAFAGEEPKTEAAAAVAAVAQLPANSLLEISLAAAIDPATAAVGDEVRAVLARPLKDGERVLVPQGAAVLGRLVRMEKQSIPFALYEVGLSFHAIEHGEGTVEFAATMEEAGPASGLIRQQKSMDPVFTKKRSARLDVLVRETQKGQGVLLWQARREVIPRGLKMKWRVE